MAAGYYPLPGYNIGPGINFEPINRALENYQNTQHHNALMIRDDRRQAIEDQRWQAQDARAQQQFALQQRRAQMEEQSIPLEQDYKRAQISLAEAQAKAAGQKNVLDEAIAGMMTEAPPPHSTPGSRNIQGGPSGFQPQSYAPSAAPHGQQNALMDQSRWQGAGNASVTPVRNFLAPPYSNTGEGQLQRVADTYAQAAPEPLDALGPQQAGPGAVYGMPGDATVNTPMGPMTRDRARRLGMGLAVGGKGDAGRMMMDAASGSANLQKPTQNALEERTLNSAMQLGRLADIEKRFNPKFLEIPNRLRLAGASWSSKFGGKLSPQIQSELREYAGFRSSTVNNANQILKELSGAAVTPQEYERIQNDIPVAGTGILDGDDPVSFMAKMDRTKSTLRSAIARLNFMRSQGLNFQKGDLDMFMSLDDVPARYEQRAGEIETRLRQSNPNITPQALEEQTGAQLKREWGI